MVENSESAPNNVVHLHAKENALIASLPSDVFQRLLPHMSIVDFEVGAVLCNCEDPLKYVYFPLRNTLISLVVCSSEGPSVEVGMVGREGFVEVTSFMGAVDAPYAIIVQGPGRAVRMDIKILLSHFNKEEVIREILLGFSRQLYISISQTALCNRIHSLEARLARWLLMSHDRVQLKELPLTHEYLAKMLGTDRGSVSVAAKTLQDLKLISYARGKISIEDAVALRKTSCECYEFLNRHIKKCSA